jgi:hypothetical protein
MKVPVGMIMLTLSGASIGVMACAFSADEWFVVIIAFLIALVLQAAGAALIGRAQP